MEIQALKAKAYALAGVGNTQQLKAKYRKIAALNLRHKVSWQEVAEFLETHPKADQTADRTIHELKSAVYKVAQVSTLRHLKTKYKPLGSLNFSFKSSWETALKLLESDQADFQSWLENPPEEYQELFAEIESASAAFDTSIQKAKALGKDAKKMAESLEQLGQEAQEEAKQLQQEAETTQQAAQQAELN